MLKKILFCSAIASGIFMYIKSHKKHNKNCNENTKTINSEFMPGEENV